MQLSSPHCQQAFASLCVHKHVLDWRPGSLSAARERTLLSSASWRALWLDCRNVRPFTVSPYARKLLMAASEVTVVPAS